jgi:hypothetical protein
MKEIDLRLKSNLHELVDEELENRSVLVFVLVGLLVKSDRRIVAREHWSELVLREK